MSVSTSWPTHEWLHAPTGSSTPTTACTACSAPSTPNTPTRAQARRRSHRGRAAQTGSAAPLRLPPGPAQPPAGCTRAPRCLLPRAPARELMATAPAGTGSTRCACTAGSGMRCHPAAARQKPGPPAAGARDRPFGIEQAGKAAQGGRRHAAPAPAQYRDAASVLCTPLRPPSLPPGHPSKPLHPCIIPRQPRRRVHGK